jgi:hypothetical protein
MKIKNKTKKKMSKDKKHEDFTNLEAKYQKIRNI